MSPRFATSLLESLPVFFAAYEVDYTFFLRSNYGIKAARFTENLVAKYTLGNWQTGDLLQITTNKMQRFLNLFIFTDDLHVLGGFSVHHKEHITVHTASGIVNQYCC